MTPEIRPNQSPNFFANMILTHLTIEVTSDGLELLDSLGECSGTVFWAGKHGGDREIPRKLILKDTDDQDFMEGKTNERFDEKGIDSFEVSITPQQLVNLVAGKAVGGSGWNGRIWFREIY